MQDSTNTQEAIVEDSSETQITSKSKRLNYGQIKELCTEAQSVRAELHKSQTKDVLDRLDAFVDEIRQLGKSKSKHLDTDEVVSDLEWIIEYYEKKEWLNVTRWLSNIDSSLREMWSNYIEKVIAMKKTIADMGLY